MFVTDDESKDSKHPEEQMDIQTFSQGYNYASAVSETTAETSSEEVNYSETKSDQEVKEESSSGVMIDEVV